MAVAARSCLAIVLAAGEGTRMQSARPKVLHEVAGLSMLGHVLTSLKQAGATHYAVVIGPDRADVAAEVRHLMPEAEIFVQKDRFGTAHAVLAARSALAKGYDDVLVAFADTPLVTAQTFLSLRQSLATGSTVVALGFEARVPTGYGRLVVENGTLTGIVEEKDASAVQKTITLCNGGLMGLDGRKALPLLEAIGNDNAKGEYYLTDSVGLAVAKGMTCSIAMADEDEVRGVNDRVQLSQVEALMQQRLREKAMRGGATLVAPETVFLSHDTVIGRDVLIEPHCYFGRGVSIADGAVIHAFCQFEGAEIGPATEIGPYARLRPGTVLASKVKIGNFVETKNAKLAEGVKANHLTYLGDTRIGKGSNIGAGTITCNYDGFLKYETIIGNDVFIGSNSALIAPVTIGDGAMVAAGSAIGGHIEADALAIVRASREVKPGVAKQFRTVKAREKARKSASPKS